MAEQYSPEPVNDIIVEFGTRLNEIEEKQRLLKDRLLLVGENLISTKEEYEKEILEIRKQVKQNEFDIKNLKQISQRIISELNNLARKEELEILERQLKIFQPLEFARIQDVKKMITEEISKIKKENK